MNIYQRIDAVRQELAYVKKDKQVDSYMAVTHDQVTSLVRVHMIKHGIVVVPCLVESKVLSTGTQTAKGTPFIRYEATYDVTFVNIAEPSDKVNVRIESHAIDHGDKAPGKAISYAVKYAMLKLFSLETGEDEESRAAEYAATVKKESAKSVAKSDFERVLAEDPDLIKKFRQTRDAVVKAFSEGKDYDAFELYSTMRDTLDDPPQVNALWYLFDSKQRAAIKELGKKANEDAPA